MSAVPPIVTRVGHTSADELRFQGHRVFGELLGRSTVAQMLVLGVSGKLLTGDELATIDDIITAMSSADPRLWPFKIARLGSANGTGAYGVAATLAGGEGGVFGTNRMASAAAWLVELERCAGTKGLTDDEIVAALEDGAQAFGVLYRTRDERFEALMRQVTKRGRHELPFTRLCLQAMRVARERKQLEAHVYLAIAALCLDLGLSTHQVAMFGIVVIFHNALANATEGALQAPAVLQELPRDRIDYRGHDVRRSPRAERANR